MAFADPFAAYNAASNIEAHRVCSILMGAGIDAFVVEDVSQVGLWVGGTISEIHKPQVWIERADIERATPLLTEYDRSRAERANAVAAGGTVAAACDECGESSEFPVEQSGSVQTCPRCGANMDVGESEDIEGWDVGDPEADEDPDVTPG